MEHMMNWLTKLYVYSRALYIRKEGLECAQTSTWTGYRAAGVYSNGSKIGVPRSARAADGIDQNQLDCATVTFRGTVLIGPLWCGFWKLNKSKPLFSGIAFGCCFLSRKILYAFCGIWLLVNSCVRLTLKLCMPCAIYCIGEKPDAKLIFFFIHQSGLFLDI